MTQLKGKQMLENQPTIIASSTVQPVASQLPVITAYPPLDKVTSPTVSTDQAAYYLNRKPQTLRKWACGESGVLLPIRINRRLAWRISDIKALVGVA